jgi:Ca2+-binding RTX toxin-like protein
LLPPPRSLPPSPRPSPLGRSRAAPTTGRPASERRRRSSGKDHITGPHADVVVGLGGKRLHRNRQRQGPRLRRRYVDDARIPSVIKGGPGEDGIIGRSGNDKILGLKGNDALRGFGGDDLLDLGSETSFGTDTCVQGPGHGARTSCEH